MRVFGRERCQPYLDNLFLAVLSFVRIQMHRLNRFAFKESSKMLSTEPGASSESDDLQVHWLFRNNWPRKFGMCSCSNWSWLSMGEDVQLVSLFSQTTKIRSQLKIQNTDCCRWPKLEPTCVWKPWICSLGVADISQLLVTVKIWLTKSNGSMFQNVNTNIG